RTIREANPERERNTPMQTVDTAMVVFELGSIALGYQALATATRQKSSRVIEASPVKASRFLILLEGPADDLKTATAEVRRLCETFSNDLLVDVELLESADPRLLPALMSLAQVEMQESLIVVETDSVAGLIALAQ